MNGRRRRLSSEDARRAIVDAATGLVATHGLEGLRVRDVAAAAGINHATLLHHFDGRDALLAALAERVIVMLAGVAAAATIPTDTAGAHRAVTNHVETIIAMMQDRPADFQMLTEVFARAAWNSDTRAVALAAEQHWVEHICRLLAPLAARHGQSWARRTAVAITLLVRGTGLAPNPDPDSLRHGVRGLIGASQDAGTSVT